MSDNEPKPMTPDMPKSKTAEAHPMTKTSAVPIRKETVRVTLKAPPQGVTGPTAPPAPLAPSAPPVAPSSPVAPSVPMSPTSAVPTSPKPPVPAPTIPLKTATPSTPVPPVPAPTVLLTGAAAGPTTKLATPAPTVKLNTPAGGPGTVPLATAAATQPLPKATVQLTQTQPMDSPASLSQAATIRTADDDDTANSGSGAAGVLSVGALLAALILLGFQLATTSIWVDGEWGKLFE